MALVPSVTGWPLTTSLAVTLVTGVPPVPALTVPESGLAVTAGVTVTLTIAVVQVAGISLSQSW